MTFISIEFFLFLPIVFSLFWFLSRSRNLQHLLLLFSSNIFYSFWNFRFLILLNLTIIIDFYCGKKIGKTNNFRVKKLYLLISVISCLSILFFFKYFNFFLESVNSVFEIKNVFYQGLIFEIVLPVGISFYTFHGISYIVDVYYNKIPFEKSYINYSLFVSFFPLLVAGPIERATNLLQQFKSKKHVFEYSLAVAGTRQILYGMFKKIVIADNLSVFVDDIFTNNGLYNGSTLLLGAFFFQYKFIVIFQDTLILL